MRVVVLVALAHRVLELPPAVAVACDTPQLERADFGDVRFETDGARVWVVPERGSFSSGVAVAGR